MHRLAPANAQEARAVTNGLTADPLPPVRESSLVGQVGNGPFFVLHATKKKEGHVAYAAYLVDPQTFAVRSLTIQKVDYLCMDPRIVFADGSVFSPHCARTKSPTFNGESMTRLPADSAQHVVERAGVPHPMLPERRQQPSACRAVKPG